MLADLFGNQNVARILLFLFVNEKCYGAQVQSLLGVPLTPVQKALQRLERGGILSSYYEGKTRVYQFNAVCPFRLELEALLKKSYTLLSAQEKKKYCFIHKPRLSFKEEKTRNLEMRESLKKFWEGLGNVKGLNFSAKTRQGEDKNVKMGKAEVVVSKPSPNVILFQEKGFWLADLFPDTAFSNTFRWTLDLNAGLIGLEHLRYGPNHPVFLFHLACTRQNFLESVDSHLCGEDTYLGHIQWHAKGIDFHWRIVGPRKNDELIYKYFNILP